MFVTCAFCGNQFKMFVEGKQVIVGKCKTEKIFYNEAAVWRCNNCKDSGINITSYGAKIYGTFQEYKKWLK
jgi:hypothetical protein